MIHCDNSEARRGLGVSKERLSALFGLALLSRSAITSPVQDLCSSGLCGFAFALVLRAPERSVVRMRDWIRCPQLLDSVLAGAEQCIATGAGSVNCGVAKRGGSLLR